MKRKVMISQPMRGLSQEEIRKNRKEVVDALEKLGFEVLDTILDLSGKDDLVKHERVFYLGESIKWLSKADILVVMNGWSETAGCKSEHNIAELYDIPIIYQKDYDWEDCIKMWEEILNDREKYK